MCWEDDSIDKVLAVQAWRPDPDLQNPPRTIRNKETNKELSMVVCVCDPTVKIYFLPTQGKTELPHPLEQPSALSALFCFLVGFGFCIFL